MKKILSQALVFFERLQIVRNTFPSEMKQTNTMQAVQNHRNLWRKNFM